MTRNELLGEITGLVGDILRELEDSGIVFKQRDVILFSDRFCKRYVLLPPIPTDERRPEFMGPND